MLSYQIISIGSSGLGISVPAIACFSLYHLVVTGVKVYCLYSKLSSNAIEKASKNSKIVEAIGLPIVRGPWYDADLAVGHRRKSVSCTFPVSGPHGSAIFHLKAIRAGGLLIIFLAFIILHLKLAQYFFVCIFLKLPTNCFVCEQDLKIGYVKLWISC